MSLTLRLLLIIVPILAQIFIIIRIRKLKMKAEDSWFWLVFSAILVILGAFPVITISIAKLLGVMSPANFVFLVIIALLMFKTFTLSTKVAMLERKLVSYVQDDVVNRKIDSEKTEEK